MDNKKATMIYVICTLEQMLSFEYKQMYALMEIM